MTTTPEDPNVQYDEADVSDEPESDAPAEPDSRDALEPDESES